MSIKNFALLPFYAVLYLWLSQPPLGFWPFALVALAPLLRIIDQTEPLDRRQYFLVWCAGLVYWLLTLQGLRHAHPAMYACWFALSAYLACYLPLFVLIVRRLIVHQVPLWISTPVAWVGLECVRNYVLTGISAAMLGHTMANVSAMIQIADMFGTYGVSFVLAWVNVALYLLWKTYHRQLTYSQVRIPLAIIGGIVGATLAYGLFRLNQSAGQPLATFALIQRDETVDYVQNENREVEIAEKYAEQTIESLKASRQPVDAIVWPESMFTGGVPWYIAEEDAKVPAAANLSSEEFHEMVQTGRSFVLQRAFVLQRTAQLAGETEEQPHLIVGSGVVRYAERPYIYSSILHLKPKGEFGDWYAKSHLVLVGEYVPLARFVPPLYRRLPRVDAGSQPKRFMVRETGVSPNICIETAVERVTLNQLAELRGRKQMPDVVVTVTNDGWFDDSSVLEHHLRCGQLVAVGTRRPLLSAANNGPTAWIDSCGRVVERLENGTHGSLIATPTRDDRISLYLRIGDWPARLLAIVCVVAVIDAAVRRRKPYLKKVGVLSELAT